MRAGGGAWALIYLLRYGHEKSKHVLAVATRVDPGPVTQRYPGSENPPITWWSQLAVRHRHLTSFLALRSPRAADTALRAKGRGRSERPGGQHYGIERSPLQRTSAEKAQKPVSRASPSWLSPTCAFSA